MAPKSRQEVLLHEGIAVPAIARQHHLDEHVLRQQNPGKMPGIRQSEDGPRHLVVVGALHLLVGIEVIHADHVEFHESAPLRYGALVVPVVMRRVHVTEDGVRQVGTLGLDDIQDAMTQAMGRVQSGEVTQAVRTAEVDGIHVHQGDLIGLHNDKLVSCGGGLQDVTLDLLAKMGAGDADLISIYYGDFVAATAAQDFAETVRSEYPSSDVELAYGGQPHYHYVLSTE